jgi:hypothetical protein
MCIDYTNLNKACPKDEYPLPRLCQIVDSTMSYELLSFLDAYSGYHQISLTIDEEQKNSIYHSIWNLLLHTDGNRTQERGSHISEGHSYCLGNSNRMKHRGLH